nr:cation:proton antiporter [Pseudomonadota bacterium]
MHGLEILQPATVLLLAGIIAATVMRRLGLPSIVGYFLAGALVGPHVLNLAPEGATVHFLAELGVVFLLFDIGMHFSLKDLWATRRQLFGLGPLQVGASALLLGGVAWLAGLAVPAALVVGAALALSST